MPSSSLGFKLSVAGGGTAATASAAAGGLYLSSSDSSTVEDSLSANQENQPQQSNENSGDKQSSLTQDSEQKQIKKVTPIRKIYSNTNAGSNLETDTIGGRYYFFLAGTSIDPSVDKETKASYIEWWNQKYNLWKTDEDTKRDDRFKGITQGYDENNVKALNKVCEEVYKQKDPLEPNSARSSTRTVTNLEYNYWRYCSDLEEKPKSLVETNEDDGDNGHIGHYMTAGHVLAATGTGHNDKFWELKQAWYESLSVEDTKFTSYVSTRVASAKTDQKISLRAVCKEAKALGLTSDSLTTQEVVKYCGFSEHLYKPYTASR